MVRVADPAVVLVGDPAAVLAVDPVAVRGMEAACKAVAHTEHTVLPDTADTEGKADREGKAGTEDTVNLRHRRYRDKADSAGLVDKGGRVDKGVVATF